MDSVTQILLGAAVGEATLGRKVGYRAAMWGGIYGTLPDLDSLIRFDNAVATVTYHRSFSHSLIVLTLVTPIFAWLIYKIHPHTSQYRKGWLYLVFFVFITHVLLDGHTVYGTQLLWPLIHYPVSWSTVFIIDPVYTLPLLTGVISVLILSRHKNIGSYINYGGLAVSSLYLVWTWTAKLYVEAQVRDSLQRQEIHYDRMLSTPAPFNSILWRFVIMDDNGYYEGFYSVLDRTDDIELTRYQDTKSLLRGIEDHWPVKRLQWFTHGFYSVNRLDNDIVMADLRMGFEPDYAFMYKVAEIGNPHPRPVKSTFVTGSWRRDQLVWVWERVINPK